MKKLVLALIIAGILLPIFWFYNLTVISMDTYSNSVDNKVTISSHFTDTKSNQGRCLPVPSPKQIKKIVNQLGNSNKASEAMSALIKLVDNSCDKEMILFYLLKQTKIVCSDTDKILTDYSFNKLEKLSNLLAQFKYKAGLDALFGCMEHTGAVSGLGISNYPARVAIIKYGEVAVPFLKDKFMTGNEELKCRISFVLAEVGGQKAKQVLSDFIENQKNKSATECIKKSLDYIKMTQP